MTMIHIKAKLVLLLSLFSLFFVSSVYGGTYFVDTHGNNSTGDGRSGSPWKTIAYALTKVKYGDTISINDGTYSEGQLKIPAGVSLTSTAQDNTKVKLQPNVSLGYTPFLLLSSTSPGSFGNQTISYLELDGINGANTAKRAIRVQNRNYVRIHHCNIHEFTGLDSFGLQVLSTQLSTSANWWDYWPANAQAVGTNTNIDALWPSNPVKNFEFDNNSMVDCGYRNIELGGAHKYKYSSIELWNLKDSTIHHNTIDNYDVGGECIKGIGGAEAFLWDVDIYNNTLVQQRFTDISIWAIELWLFRGGCEIYNNVSNAGFSVTVGKETSIYNNQIVYNPPIVYPNPTSHSYGIEFNLQSHGSVYDNSITGTRGGGISVGMAKECNSKNWIVEYQTIRNNRIYNDSEVGIYLKAHGAFLSPNYVSTTRYINIYDNLVDGETSEERGDQYYRTTRGIKLVQQDYKGTSVLSNVNVYNNTIIDVTGYAGSTKGSVNNLVIDANRFYGNSYNSWKGSIATKTITTEPASDPVKLNNTDSVFSKPTLGSGGNINIPPNGGIDIPSSDPVIGDNTDAAFSTVGSWVTSSSTPGYYGSNYRYAGPGNGSKQATWSFSVSAGKYEISAQWSAFDNRPSNAVYRVYNNGVEIGTQIFDQRVNGGRFNVFDTSYVVDAGTLDVVLTDDANGYVIADAVKLVSLPISPPSGFKIGTK